MTLAPRAALPPAIARWRLLAYAGGDFAFNLYWQSVMLYLLFYYTESVHLSLPSAAACYAVAMAWDGIISLVIGLWVDRYVGPRRVRAMIAWSAAPLGLSFVAAYALPPAGLMHGGLAGWGVFGWVLVGHLVFRTIYGLANIPYLALSARLCADERDRDGARLAGWRMLAGTLAAVLVAWGTLPLGTALAGTAGPAAYASAAIAFAILGTTVLLGAVWAVPKDQTPPGPPATTQLQALVNVWVDRGFVTLGVAMMAMIIAGTMIDKAVLYYFKYHLHDQSAGELALAWMMATGAVAVPAWMALSARTGTRYAWFAGVALSSAALVVFIAGVVAGSVGLKLFLVVVQAALIGLQFAVWALLPGVIARAERRSGTAMGAVIYGYFATLQRVAIGVGTLLLGHVLGAIGLERQAVSGEALRLAIAAPPLLLLWTAAGVMWAGRRAR